MSAELKQALYNEDLATLKYALDESCVKEVLGQLLHQQAGESLQIRGVEIEVLRERSKRCVLRYCVHAWERNQNREVTLGVIGKVFKPTVGEKVFENMQLLWRNGFARDAQDGISMPEPLGFLPALCLLVQEEVPGFTLKILLNQCGQTEHFRQLGRALAKLHQCAVTPGEPFTVRDHLMRCHPKHEFLSMACPELASSIDYLVARAGQIEAALAPFKLTPLHGDFHLGQIHLNNGRVWLIDFDALSYGDPAADLGNLLVFLKAKASKNPEIDRLIQTFLDEYFSIMSRDIAARIPLYEALTHLRRACKCLRLQKEEWHKKATQMIEQAVAIINQLDVH
jgi:tRNA A-37 threonylcarbamoyl transferase component Bud32